MKTLSLRWLPVSVLLAFLLAAGCSAIRSPTSAPTPTLGNASPGSVASLHDLGWIAFSSQRDGNYEIYIVRPDGTDTRRLTRDPADDVAPALSPDGKHIAFASRRSGNYEIYAMDRDGSAVVQLTHDAADDVQPSWSPDGKRLAFASKRAGEFGIYTMANDGSDVRPVTAGMMATAPAWSPDGKHIAFWSMGILLIDTEGKNPQQIVDSSAFPSSPPAWSPDGRRMAFAAIFQGGAPEVDVLTIADKTRGRFRFAATGPTWSPDGAWIAYSSGGRLYVSDPSATREIEISDDGREPSWGR